MDRLPAELIIHLCYILPLPELKTFRLCCKAFATHGQAALFESFGYHLRPTRKRLSQLESLAVVPNVASKLRKLSLTTGVLLEYADYRYWQAQVYKELSSDWFQSLAGQTPSREEYNIFHNALQARFTEEMRYKYADYRWFLDVDASVTAQQFPSRLLEAMNRLSQHNSEVSFELSMAEPQITIDEVQAFVTPAYLSRQPEVHDPRQRVFNRRQAVLDHFLGFLSAASESSLRLRDLIVNCLPLQLLELPGEQATGTLDAAFADLRRLKLSVSSLPHSDWLSRAGLASAPYTRGRNPAARRLRELLNRPAKLESLDLALLPGKEAELSFELFDRINLDRFPRHFLKSLRTLSLSHFSCSWTDLKVFLQEAVSLKDLTLANARLETGGILDLLTFVPELRLQSAKLLGRWLVDEDRGEWHAHTPFDFTDCADAIVYEGPYVERGLKSRIEAYMVNGGDVCPIHDERTWESIGGDTSWHYIPRR